MNRRHTFALQSSHSMTFGCNGSLAGRQASGCSARSAAFRSSFQGVKLARTAPQHSRQTSSVRIFAANPVGGVAKYLSDAAKQIFSVQDNDVTQPPWGGSGSGFAGSISHHEDTARLRAVYEAVKSTRESITGCTDPNAANFDPAAVVDDGTCNYIADTNEETGMSEDLRGYVTKTLSNVWSHNFKGSDTEPKDWGSTGYSYRGQKVSQRDIMRLLEYEKVVKGALDEAEKAEK